MFELRLVIVGVVYYALYRLARRLPRAREIQEADVEPVSPAAEGQVGRERPAPSSGELRTVREWAFDYERMLLEDALPARQRDRLIHLVSRQVVPLVGQVRVCDLDDDLVRSVGHVLAVQAGDGEARYVARAWAHIAGWVRYHAAPPERRNIWTLLDPDVLRLYDELTGD